jgi:amino acid transporter
MSAQGLRPRAPVSKQNRNEERLAVPRALVIIAIIALIALIAGFLAFGGGNMGH